MIDPDSCIPGKLDFAKKFKKKTTKKPLSGPAKIDPPPKAGTKEKSFTEATEEAIMQMTPAEIKFQKYHANYIKTALDNTKGLSHRQIIENTNKILENTAMHNDLEGD